MAEYQAYAKEFDPTNFNAEEWVKIAKDAGQKYIVITSKHHDGFAMFDSKASDWNIVKATPFGRDPLKELAAACQKEGIKLGFYYSQAQDWNNGGSACGGKWDPAQQHDMDDYIDHVAVPQVKEILSNYGQFPAVLWWDTRDQYERQPRAETLRHGGKTAPGHHHEQPSGRRLPGRHRNAGANHPRARLSRPRLGNLHDDQRHLGLQAGRQPISSPPRRSSAICATSPARAEIICSTSARPARA